MEYGGVNKSLHACKLIPEDCWPWHESASAWNILELASSEVQQQEVCQFYQSMTGRKKADKEFADHHSLPVAWHHEVHEIDLKC